MAKYCVKKFKNLKISLKTHFIFFATVESCLHGPLKVFISDQKCERPDNVALVRFGDFPIRATQ